MKRIAAPSFLKELKNKLESSKIPSKVIFVVLGIASTLWFLIRVIPKPSRAYYPCMQTAAPFMSAFVVYLLSLGTAMFAFRKAREKFYQARYYVAGLLLVVSLTSAIFITIQNAREANAATGPADAANAPMGTARGIMPGRVVWAWDSAATNANALNKLYYDEIEGTYDTSFFFSPKNNDQTVIDQMVADAIKMLANKNTEEEAWDAIFKYFNKQQTGIEKGYDSTQIIFIKINMGSMSWNGKFSAFDLSRNLLSDPNIVESNPFTISALLKSLTIKGKVPQNKIVVGEPMRNVYQDVFDYIKKDFKDVNILGNDILGMFSSVDLINLNRTPVAVGNDSIYYAAGNMKDPLYDVYTYSSYVINMAALKGHFRAGITLCAKNHFGSQAKLTNSWNGKSASAEHLHPYLISPDEKFVTNDGYKKYRPQVDLIGHPKLGGKTLLFFVDGLYSGRDGYKAPSLKWKSYPFNNNYPSSIFISQDQVALESVCYDFLRTEYVTTPTDSTKTDAPNYYGVDDYLHQSADKVNWPSGVLYKPDGKTEMTSMGAHEHWNNATDKKYSRNLDALSGKGIELVGVMKAHQYLSDKKVRMPIADIKSIYPNPANSYVNIEFATINSAEVTITIYDISGRQIATLLKKNLPEGTYTHTWDVSQMPQAVYLCNISIKEENETKVLKGKIQVIR